MHFQTIASPYKMTPLETNGLTNETWLLNDIYFVKKSNKIFDTFLDRNNEIAVLSLLQDKPFLLPIREFQKIDQILYTVMPYYHNLTTLKDVSLDENILIKIKGLIQKFQGITVTDQIHKWDAVKKLEHFSSLPKKNQTLDDLKADIIRWCISYEPKKWVLSHNDLIADNFAILDNELYLYDFDYVSLNDSWFDVASFASEALNSKEDVAIWFKVWKLIPEEEKIVKCWMKYQNLLWYYWASYLFEKTENPVYQNIANHKYKKLGL